MIASSLLIAWTMLAADPIRLIAHRGGVVSVEFAENSPASLEEAVKRGYWMIEVDVRESKDGVLVVQHDPDFDRFYGVKRNVSDMTWDEISKLRATPGNTRPMTFRELCERAGAGRGRRGPLSESGTRSRRHPLPAGPKDARLQLMIDTKEPSHPDAFYREMESAMKANGLLKSAYFIGTAESRKWFRGKARTSATAAELRKYASAGEPVGKHYFLFEWGTMTRESVDWAFANKVPVVPSINLFHYGGNDPIGRGTNDLKRLRTWGVHEFQIDSIYDGAFTRK